MNDFNSIHETAIRDITDTITDGIKSVDKVTRSGYVGSVSTASSISKATNGLTLVFPVLIDNTLPMSTAAMITKAVERKAVSLLQIAFSAFNITNSKDAYDYIKNFHTNVGGKMSMDSVISALDSLSESTAMSRENRAMYQAVMEDFKKLCNYHLEDDINESSINDYKILNRNNNIVVVKELLNDNDMQDLNADYRRARITNNTGVQNRVNYDVNGVRSNSSTTVNNFSLNDRLKQAEFRSKEDNERQRRAEKAADNEYRQHRDEIDDEFREKKYDHDVRYKNRRDMIQDEKDRKKYELNKQRSEIQNAKDNIEMLQKQLLPSDVKKANEMVPTMMIINFKTTDEATQNVIARQVIIGVKAKMVAVDPEEVSNKIITKRADGNILLKLIRTSTREISFVKDFLFAIDNAKLNAIANSSKGTPTYKYLRLLERRALNGKVRKALRANNCSKAIATIVLSSEMVDHIRKYSNIDIMKPEVIRPIMEKLSTMMFIVADESMECIHLLMDTGDDTYETLAYTSLEREASDGASKKAINLMTKLV